MGYIRICPLLTVFICTLPKKKKKKKVIKQKEKTEWEQEKTKQMFDFYKQNIKGIEKKNLRIIKTIEINWFSKKRKKQQWINVSLFDVCCLENIVDTPR